MSPALWNKHNEQGVRTAITKAKRLLQFEALYSIAIVEQLSTECRKTNTEVITLASHKLNYTDNPVN